MVIGRKVTIKCVVTGDSLFFTLCSFFFFIDFFKLKLVVSVLVWLVSLKSSFGKSVGAEAAAIRNM